MSDTTPKVPQFALTQEQLDKIAGGDCTIKDWVEISDQLKDAYENLIDFTSYVIERVAGPAGS
jgi:hypothetical protein